MAGGSDVFTSSHPLAFYPFACETMLFRLWPAFLVAALYGLGAMSLAAQTDGDDPRARCTIPETEQFAFWIGEWELSWGEKGQGTNTIRPVLDGCVIEERFQDLTPDGPGLQGISVSTYDPAEGKWKQTWVDNTGSYLDFTGGIDGDRMILSRETTRDGHPLLQRMVWYSISPDSLDWNWERSADGGKSWKVLWKIHYGRR